MRIKYRGWMKDLDCLPEYERYEGAIKFKEPETPSELSKGLIGYSVGTVLFIFVAMGLGNSFGANKDVFFNFSIGTFFLGIVCFFLMIFPHEILHGIAYGKGGEGNIYIGAGFACVTTGKIISKGQFIFMCLLPNLVLGGIPLLVWGFIPLPSVVSGTLVMYIPLTLLGGAGDYMNVLNTIRQVPSGGYVQQSGMHSYWYDNDYERRGKETKASLKRGV